MKNTYIYPAIFNYGSDGISISFPDLPGCLSQANATEEAIKNAEEALGLWMYEIEEEKEDIPAPTPIEKVHCESNEKAFLIKTWMPLARMEIEQQSVKKTLTIPQWLNKLAEENNVNFSQILQAALKEYLNVSEPTK